MTETYVAVEPASINTATSLQDGILSVLVPMQKLHTSRQLLIVPSAKRGATASANTTVKRVPNAKLVRALVKAHQYQKLLDSGKYPNAKALAKKYGVGVYDVLPLNLLAPKIKAAILNGNQARELSLLKLRQGFSDSWQEQIKNFVFL